jgi:hypothetical protein
MTSYANLRALNSLPAGTVRSGSGDRCVTAQKGAHP